MVNSMSNQYRYKFCGHSPSYLAHFIGNADTQDITYTLYAMHLLTTVGHTGQVYISQGLSLFQLLPTNTWGPGTATCVM